MGKNGWVGECTGRTRAWGAGTLKTASSLLLPSPRPRVPPNRWQQPHLCLMWFRLTSPPRLVAVRAAAAPESAPPTVVAPLPPCTPLCSPAGGGSCREPTSEAELGTRSSRQPGRRLANLAKWEGKPAQAPSPLMALLLGRAVPPEGRPLVVPSLPDASCCTAATARPRLLGPAAAAAAGAAAGRSTPPPVSMLLLCRWPAEQSGVSPDTSSSAASCVRTSSSAAICEQVPSGRLRRAQLALPR